jgi:hypothetical protein
VFHIEAYFKNFELKLDLDLPAYLFEPSVDKNMLAKYLETEINEQAKIVEDLQKLGASDHFIRYS